MLEINKLVKYPKYETSIFKIVDIQNDLCYLKGVDTRYYITAKKIDLVELDERGEIKEKYQINKINDLMQGKVLHLDSDKDYLNTSLEVYKENAIPAVGYLINEADLAINIKSLLLKHHPDVLVITGHDYYSDGIYQNSKHFAKAVKIAREYAPSKESLVIIAGACESDYESLIASGANFASSPKRIAIKVLDPVKIAINVSKTHFSEYLNINNLLNETSRGKDGIGGIDSKGVARKIY